jgi:hypothetical protein
VATISSITFNAGSGGVDGTYATGDPIDATVDYVPDTPSVVPQSFTLTANVSDAAGNVTATSSAPFTVNTTQPSGDTVAVTDTGNRTWTEGATTPDGSGGLDTVFSATA